MMLKSKQSVFVHTLHLAKYNMCKCRCCYVILNIPNKLEFVGRERFELQCGLLTATAMLLCSFVQMSERAVRAHRRSRRTAARFFIA